LEKILMSKRTSRAAPAWVLTLLGLLGACTDDETVSPVGGGGADDGGGGSGGGPTSGGGGEGAGYEGPCTELTLGDTSIFFQSIGRAAVEAPVSPAVEGLAKTRLTMELYDYDFDLGVPWPLEPGTFEFATPPDDNYGTCQHCVLLVAYDLSGAPKRAFYPQNGTFVLEEIGLDFPSYVVGSASDMELVEVIQNEDFTWEELPGGDCYYVESWAFDTYPVDGGECSSVEQCPNEASQICEPDTGTCGEWQCDLFGDVPCGEGEVCLSQIFEPSEEPYGPAIGACYDVCDPAEPTSCGADAYCRPLGLTQSFGACYATGTGQVGDACTPRDISTECVAGAVCTGTPGECARVCDFLRPESGCDPERYCAFSNLCEPAQIGDAAAVGETCSPSSPETVECGVEGDAFRGLCIRWFPDAPDMSCERLCRMEDPDCPGEETCLGVFADPGFGVCHVPAVCGDGELDLIGGEICDDGNTQSGDGCSADCLTPELGPLCDVSGALPEGTEVAGDTSEGPSGYPSQCDPFIGTRVSTYSYVAPGPGQVRLTLDSAEDLRLSVYAECDDPATELGCQSEGDYDELIVDLDAAPAGPLLVIVRGASPIHEGAFTIHAEFTAAVCGDGLAVGPEECDDGNTTSGDGCSGDCLTVEWANVCAALPALSTSAVNTGTTAGAASLFETGSLCAVGPGGRERAYSFVAPSDGTLELTLTQPQSDFALFIQDGCGPSGFDVWLGCGSSTLTGGEETASTILSAGQDVTVIVDGSTDAEVGPYELTATFTP
jgi:cysteine-rich repeat protein